MSMPIHTTRRYSGQPQDRMQEPSRPWTPVTTCGLRLDDEAVRIAVGLRLGTGICEPHACPCGARVTADGAHGLSCGLGLSWTGARHTQSDSSYRFYFNYSYSYS